MLGRDPMDKAERKGNQQRARFWGGKRCSHCTAQVELSGCAFRHKIQEGVFVGVGAKQGVVSEMRARSGRGSGVGTTAR